MQVVLSAPPAAAPVSAAPSAFSPAVAGDENASFAFVLDSSSGHAAPAAAQPSISPSAPAAAVSSEPRVGTEPDPTEEPSPDQIAALWTEGLFLPPPPLLESLPESSPPESSASAPETGPADAPAGANTSLPGEARVEAPPPDAFGRSASVPAVAVLNNVRPALVRPERFNPRPLSPDKQAHAEVGPHGAAPAELSGPETSTAVPTEVAPVAAADVPRAAWATANAVRLAQPDHAGLKAATTAISAETIPAVADTASAAAPAMGAEAIPGDLLRASGPTRGAGAGVELPPTSEAAVQTASVAATALLGGATDQVEAAAVSPVSVPQPGSPSRNSDPLARGEAVSRVPTSGRARSIGVPSAPGLRVTVQSAETNSASPAPMPVVVSAPAADPMAAALASPVVAAPTLAQVLVENGQNRGPRGATTPGEPVSANPASAATPALVDDFGLPAPTVAAHGVASDVAANGTTETAGAAVTLPRVARENLAVGRGRAGAVNGGEVAASSRRNFLSVEQQGVGEEGERVGTGVAKEAQPMSSHAPVLPPAATPALAASEPAAAVVTGTGAASASIDRHNAEPAQVRSTAAAAVTAMVDAAERMQQAGRNHVELRIQTPGDAGVQVHLRWHDGVVEAKFVAQTPELQQALSREWAQISPRMEDKGLKFSEPSFEHRDQSGQSSAQNAFSFDQQRHSSRGQGQAEDSVFALPALKATASTAVARGTSVTTGARVVVPNTSTSVTPNPADARALRAWA